jgi:cobalt-zinc-cadmium efflux system outer membrane protein
VLSAVLAQNPLVQAAGARVRAAQAARRTAGAWPNPLLAYEVENEAFSSRSVLVMERETMTTAELPLQMVYQRWPRVARANAEVAAASAQAVRERQTIAMAAASAFYRASLAQVRLEAAHDLGMWLDSIVAYNRVRAKEGAAAEADLLRSEVERDRVAAEETMLMVDFLNASAELRTFTGDSLGGPIAVDSVPFAVPASQQTLDVLVAARPDVQAASRRMEAARAGIGVERSMIVPDISAMLGVKQTGGASSLIAGASMPFPLFHQNRGEIARASASRDIAGFELAATERAARSELAAAEQSARVLTERATALAAGFLARADEARRITLGAYQENALPLLNVIDAARTWGEARSTHYQTLFAQQESVLRLFVARGGDLSNWNQPQSR